LLESGDAVYIPVFFWRSRFDLVNGNTEMSHRRFARFIKSHAGLDARDIKVPGVD
jgi:hypothetical protein